MRKPVIMSLVIVWMMVAGPAAAQENIESLVAQALAANPEIVASEARWRMFQQRITQAGALEDPMLMIGIQNAMVRDPLDFRRDPMTQKVIGISQMIPYRGKRAAKIAEARSEAEASRWQLEERKLELAQMVRETAYRLYAVDHAFKLTERNLSLFDDLITLAEARYAVGQGELQEILGAQVERSRMQDMLLVLQRQRTSQQALLNELLARPQTTPVGAIPELSPEPLVFEFEVLRRQALAERPLLQSLAALHDKSRSSRKLAELDFYPDFTVSFEYMQRDRLRSGMGDIEGDDMYGLTLSFNLPVRRAQRKAMVQETKAESAMVGAELHAQQNAIERDLVERLAELNQGAAQLRLYREAILPQAEQSLAAALAAYQVGKLDFSMLLERQMALFTYQSEYYRMLTDYHMTQAQLRTLVGGSLDEPVMAHNLDGWNQ